MENIFNQIEAYIDGKLVGKELSNFEAELQINPSLQKEVDIYRGVIEGIRAKEAANLRMKFSVLDAVLDKELELSDKKSTLVQQEETIEPKVVPMPIYRTTLFRVAATIVLVLSAYLLLAPPSENAATQPSFAIEDYEVEYKGWEKKNTLLPTRRTPQHASQDAIGNNESLDEQSEQGELSPTAPSFATPEEIEQQYKEAQGQFVSGNYAETILSLQKIRDENTSRKNFRLGMAYYSNGDLKNAKKHLELSLEQTQLLSVGDETTAKWYVAMTYVKQNNHKAALTYFNELANSENTYTQKAKELVGKMK